MSHNFVDLSGQRFTHLTVIKRVENKITKSGYSHVQYMCKCDCGETINIMAAQLRKGHKKSCSGCNLTSLKRDLVGQVFDKLTVLREDGYYEYPSGERDYKWRCLCECGNEATFRGNSLKSKGNHNCGCYRKSSRISDSDMVGKRFGRLTVISRESNIMSTTGTAVNRWLCECACGRDVIVRGASLRNGHTSSCGCYRFEMLSVSADYKSKSEEDVIAYLDSAGLTYIREKTYVDLIGVGEGLLSYDFYIEVKPNVFILVECHGLQHYEPVEFFGGQLAYERQVEHDARKRLYAKTHKIPLLEINCNRRTRDEIWSELDSYITTIL